VDDIYRAALEKWGAEAQFDQMVEECAEMITVLKHYRRGRVGEAEVIAELADVTLMTGQLTHMFGAEKIRQAINSKMLKIRELLGHEEAIHQIRSLSMRTKIERKGPGIMGRLQRGDDLLETLTAICRTEEIRLGRLEAIGAVEKARVGFYDQAAREYRYLEFDCPLEILALKGNISLRDSEPMVHAHGTFSDAEGKVFGGHLAHGTRVFACEYLIEPFSGDPLERGFDEGTGLPLWQTKQVRSEE
jgi:uncharacterized protein